MRVIVRAKAADDLAGIFEWIRKQSMDAAVATLLRIRRRIAILEMPECTHIGRSGRDEGTRELVEGNYIIVYEVNERRKNVSVLAVYHGAQDR